MISEILKIALQFKGEELSWVATKLGSFISQLWAAVNLPASLWWWVVPGLITWVLGFALLIFLGVPEEKEFRLRPRTRLIGATITLFVGWVYWNVLAATMQYFEYATNPRLIAIVNMALGAVIDLIIMIILFSGAAVVVALIRGVD